MTSDNFDYKYSEIGNFTIFNLAILMFKRISLYIINFFSLNIFILYCSLVCIGVCPLLFFTPPKNTLDRL